MKRPTVRNKGVMPTSDLGWLFSFSFARNLTVVLVAIAGLSVACGVLLERLDSYEDPPAIRDRTPSPATTAVPPAPLERTA